MTGPELGNDDYQINVNREFDRTTLTSKALDRLGVKLGDSVYLVETPDGYELVPCDAEFQRQIKIAKKGMRRYRNALRELAK